MSDVHDMLRRARELAALADNAMPGPWELEPGATRVWLSDAVYVSIVAVDGRPVNEQDKALIAAAPDMVRLLRQLADTLAELESVETGITP